MNSTKTGVQMYRVHGFKRINGWWVNPSDLSNSRGIWFQLLPLVSHAIYRLMSLINELMSSDEVNE